MTMWFSKLYKLLMADMFEGHITRKNLVHFLTKSQKNHKNHRKHRRKITQKSQKNHCDFWNHKNLVHVFVSDMPLGYVCNAYALLCCFLLPPIDCSLLNQYCFDVIRRLTIIEPFIFVINWVTRWMRYFYIPMKDVDKLRMSSNSNTTRENLHYFVF